MHQHRPQYEHPVIEALRKGDAETALRKIKKKEFESLHRAGGLAKVEEEAFALGHAAITEELLKAYSLYCLVEPLVGAEQKRARLISLINSGLATGNAENTRLLFSHMAIQKAAADRLFTPGICAGLEACDAENTKELIAGCEERAVFHIFRLPTYGDALRDDRVRESIRIALRSGGADNMQELLRSEVITQDIGEGKYNQAVNEAFLEAHSDYLKTGDTELLETLISSPEVRGLIGHRVVLFPQVQAIAEDFLPHSFFEEAPPEGAEPEAEVFESKPRQPRWVIKELSAFKRFLG